MVIPNGFQNNRYEGSRPIVGRVRGIAFADRRNHGVFPRIWKSRRFERKIIRDAKEEPTEGNILRTMGGYGPDRTV